ncbi:MAG: hypothetical protein MZV63_35035 [Marinilabiliales bacterium]|nr:hypothetical protein [Marinilabiliales bacterium]
MVIVTYDLVIGAFHLLFVMTIAQRLFLSFLPGYSYIDPATGNAEASESGDPYWGMLKRNMALPLLKAFGAAVVIFGIGAAATSSCSRVITDDSSYPDNNNTGDRCFIDPGNKENR